MIVKNVKCPDVLSDYLPLVFHNCDWILIRTRHNGYHYLLFASLAPMYCAKTACVKPVLFRMDLISPVSAEKRSCFSSLKTLNLSSVICWRRTLSLMDFGSEPNWSWTFFPKLSVKNHWRAAIWQPSNIDK